jgi:hypothetical protein
VGRPLARALLPCGDRRGEDKEWVAAFEGCAVAAQGATLACRPATPSSETVVRGLLGTAEGAEADAFARAARRAAGKDAARRRGDAEDVSRVVGSSAAFRLGGPGDFQAETLLSVLGVARARRAVLYAEAVERAASVGDVSRAARLAPKAAPKAATAMCVAACLGEWRAADALDHLDHLASTKKSLAERAAEANEKRKTRDDASMSRTDRDRDRDRDPREDDDEAWLRLCCAAHLELSAWAASAAAAAIGAAGEIAEELPDASASFPWPSGALSPPLAADAADALARSAAEATPAHRSLGSLQAAARAARRAADAAAGITAFVRGTVFASARGDDEKTRAARRDACVFAPRDAGRGVRRGHVPPRRRCDAALRGVRRGGGGARRVDKARRGGRGGGGRKKRGAFAVVGGARRFYGVDKRGARFAGWPITVFRRVETRDRRRASPDAPRGDRRARVCGVRVRVRLGRGGDPRRRAPLVSR